MQKESRGRDGDDDEGAHELERDDAVDEEVVDDEAFDASGDESGQPDEASERGLAAFQQPWLLASALCLVAAAACALLGNFDAAFVTAALGVLAWFLNVRANLGAKE